MGIGTPLAGATDVEQGMAVHALVPALSSEMCQCGFAPKDLRAACACETEGGAGSGVQHLALRAGHEIALEWDQRVRQSR